MRRCTPAGVRVSASRSYRSWRAGERDGERVNTTRKPSGVPLGPVAVSFATVTTRAELLSVMSMLAESLPATDPANGRIVLIIPERLRAVMHWPLEGAPRVDVWLDELVFRRND
jgi:hypothetical protein